MFSDNVLIAVFGGIITLSVAAVGPATTIILARMKDKADREALNKAQTDRTELKDLTQQVLNAGGEREERINAKIDENTMVTQEAAEATKAVRSHLESLQEQRAATTLALKAPHAKPEFFEIRLPGIDYETFGLTTGALVEWKSEHVEKGRQVRFLAHGPATMGFHFHRVTEVIFTMRGKLIYETPDTVVEVFPGEYYQADIDAVHSATLEESGEVVCHWPEQDSDILLIGIYPQSP